MAGYYNGTNIEVRVVFKGAPAEGQLRRGDVITGVNGNPFGTHRFVPTVPKYHQDFRQGPAIMADGKSAIQSYRELGEAIDHSERDGKLTLQILRDGQPQNVDLALKPIGTHGPTYPFADSKSAIIVRDACQFLVQHQQPSGRWPTAHGEPTGPALTTAVCGLALLASGDAQYLPQVRKAVYGMLDKLFSTYQNRPLFTLGLQNWHLAFACIFTSEYYLRTGDKDVLPRLQTLADYMLKLQLITADHGLGGWGHGAVADNPGPHPKTSYRELNICAAQNLLALALMSRCGIKLDTDHLRAAEDYLEKTAGETGAIDYSHWALHAGGGTSPAATASAPVFDWTASRTWRSRRRWPSCSGCRSRRPKAGSCAKSYADFLAFAVCPAGKRNSPRLPTRMVLAYAVG